MKPPPQGLPDTDDPYVLLDVRPGASAEQIRRAYLRRVKVWKPDRHPAEFRRVREAYDRLREQEKWFEAWLAAGDVVRRAAEEAARTEDEGEAPASDAAGDAAQAGGEPTADPEAGSEALREPEDDVPAEDEAAEDDVDALIAALEEELRDAPELDETDTPEHRRRARAAAAAERLAALEHDVHAALEAGRFADAADRLLEPGIERLAAHREFAPLLLEVCCAVVWELPPRFEALVGRFGDLVSAHDTEHHDGALLHRRILADQLPAWRQAVAGWPELHRFVTLGSSLRAPAEAELGLRLGRRAAADPTGFLEVLARAAEHAPGIVELYSAMAARWAQSYGRLPLQRPMRARPTVEQAAAALADATLRHRRVRWEQARPLLVALALVLAPVLTPSPLVELVVVALIVLLWAFRAWAPASAERIYAQVVRPAAAAWLWSTHASPDALATALHARLPPRGSLGAVLHPGDVEAYPARLRSDLALLAFGVTAPMIPLLRAPASSGSPT